VQQIPLGDVLSEGMRRVFTLGFAVLVALLWLSGAWLRFQGLEDKPMHGDEAEQSYTLSRLLAGEGYTYNSKDHHGPVLYYFAALACKLAGQTDFGALTVPVVRLVPVLFGVVLVGAPLLWLRKRGVGHGAVGLAMLLGATSPMAVYYARYFIQETLFVTCFWLAIPLLWFAPPGERGKRQWATAASAGVLLGLTVALKETWFLMATAAGIGVVAAMAADAPGTWRRLPGNVRAMAPRWGAVFAMAIGVAALFLSSLLENPRGIVDFVASYGNYLDKASGGAHDKPFGWYFPVLFDARPLLRECLMTLGLGSTVKSLHLMGMVAPVRELFAGLGCVLALGFLPVRSAWRGEERRVAVFCLSSGATLFLLYSLISYKTPWLMLGVLPPLWLAAALGSVALWRQVRTGIHCTWTRRGTLVALAMAAGTAGVVQWKAANLLSRRLGADARNPMAYVHTTDGVKNIERQANLLASVTPAETPIHVAIYSREYAPLIWYLRQHFHKTVFCRSIPSNDNWPWDVPLVIVDENMRTEVVARLHGPYAEDIVGLRPGVILYVYLRKDLLDQALEQEARSPVNGKAQ
jgi:uncharacterized protein (TIGR03663 family)